jgi:magnesium chelatase family protein
MSLALVYSRGLSGVKAPQVQVEVHAANGLPTLTIVGLADIEVREARDRVRAAILNSGFDFPARKITVNLAPADLPKESGRFDLAIALGILAATGQIPKDNLSEYEWAGELSLSGELRPIRGSLAMSFALFEHNNKHPQQQRKFVLPTANASEASLVEQVIVLPADSLASVCAMLHSLVNPSYKSSYAANISEIKPYKNIHNDNGHNLHKSKYPNLSDVRGQQQAKRALEIAAAGGHSLLMIGSPGTGKSMLASRLPSILPAMTQIEALESAAVTSLMGQFDSADWQKRPYRSPHHTASAVAMVGGSSNPRPGEISLSHHGVLFLDELPEFDRKVLEVLREPLETGHITISRAGKQADFPAKFQLIAAMNPCPCGYLGHATKNCRCTPDQVNRYQGRLSGPFLDRIDLQIEVPALSHEELLDKNINANNRANNSDNINPYKKAAETSEQVAIRVSLARDIQLKRQQKPNAALAGTEIDEHCELHESGIALLKQAMTKLGWSARACHRALKVARTIADLDNSEKIMQQHIAEAIQYRRALKAGNI